MIEENFQPKLFFDDIATREISHVPEVDIYVAGFPCQPFSTAGKQQGFSDDKGRGTVFFHIVEYLKAKRPKVFILENVKGIVSLENGKYLKSIISVLESIGCYKIRWQVLNTQDNGIPQLRSR